MSNYLCKFNQLVLDNFRNFTNLSLNLDSTNIKVIVGKNGLGKTNLLEAISLFAAGRGLRSAKLSEIQNINNPKRDWVLFAQINSRQGEVKIGTSHIKGKDKRIIRIDSTDLKTNSQLQEYLSIFYITPALDMVFHSSTARRELLDNLVSNYYPNHSELLSNFDKLKSERRVLLYKSADEIWLKNIESQMANIALDITANRVGLIDHLNALNLDNLPKANYKLSGWLEDNLTIEQYTLKLAESRDSDKQTGRTNYGPHRSAFEVIHEAKNAQAQQCSTGEQKSLLLALIIAAVKIYQDIYEASPILLLDEVIAHIDETKREQLFKDLIALNCQCFLTGVDEEFFTPLKENAEFIRLG